MYGGWASFGSEEMAAVSNQYAAMPSMHIGWSTWCALVLAPLMRRRWLRWLAIAYPLLTLFCIIVTGNHYWIDGARRPRLPGRRLPDRPVDDAAWWEARRGADPPEPGTRRRSRLGPDPARRAAPDLRQPVGAPQ